MKFTATLLASAIAAISFCQAAGPTAKATTAAPTAVQAKQHKGLSRAEREKIRDEVLVQLNVGTEKTVKIKDLDQELKAKAKASHKADKGLPTDDKKKEAKELHEWYVGKMKEILGETDYKKFADLMKEKIKEARKAAEANAPKP